MLSRTPRLKLKFWKSLQKDRGMESATGGWINKRAVQTSTSFYFVIVFAFSCFGSHVQEKLLLEKKLKHFQHFQLLLLKKSFKWKKGDYTVEDL